MLVLLLSGCTSLDAGSSHGAPAQDTAPGDPNILPTVFAPTPHFTLPDLPAPREIPLAVNVDPAWLKPLEMTTARADAGSAASALGYAWYVGLEGARIRVTYIDDIPYLTDPDRVHGQASGEHVREGPVSPVVALDTGRLEPGAAPVALSFPVEGRFELAPREGGPAARLNVTVSADVPLGTPAYVRVRDGAPDPREVDVHPGDAVLFYNEGPAPARFSIAGVLVRLEGRGAALPVAPVDEGAYELVAIARDASGARGVAGARIVSDFERPDPAASFGPWSTVFACTGLDACDDDRAYTIHAALDLRSLVVNVSSNAPLGATFNLTLVGRAGAAVAAATLADGEALVARDLPAGDYTLRVHAESGALAGFTASAQALYRLPPPP